MYKTYLKDIDLYEKKEKIEDIIDMLMCNAKNTDNHLYKHIEGEMYEMAYGKKINSEMASNWVKNMKPYGEHWSMEETTGAMNSMGFNLEKVEFYVVANMMYNDYFNLVKDNDELTLKLAEDWLEDEDSKDCKLYEYWKHVIRK